MPRSVARASRWQDVQGLPWVPGAKYLGAGDNRVGFGNAVAEALAAGGSGCILLSPGAFTINAIANAAAAVSITDHLRIEGEHPTGTILHLGPDTPSGAYTWFELARNKRLEFRNLTIVGPTNRGTGANYGIQCHGSDALQGTGTGTNDGVNNLTDTTFAQALMPGVFFDNVRVSGNLDTLLYIPEEAGKTGEFHTRIKNCDLGTAGTILQQRAADTARHQVTIRNTTIRTFGASGGMLFDPHVNLLLSGLRFLAGPSGSYCIQHSGSGKVTAPEQVVFENVLCGPGTDHSILTSDLTALSGATWMDACGFKGGYGPECRGYTNIGNCELQPSVLAGWAAKLLAGGPAVAAGNAYWTMNVRDVRGWMQCQILAAGAGVGEVSGCMDIRRDTAGQGPGVKGTAGVFWHVHHNRFHTGALANQSPAIQVNNDEWVMRDNEFAGGYALAAVEVVAGSTQPVVMDRQHYLVTAGGAIDDSGNAGIIEGEGNWFESGTVRFTNRQGLVVRPAEYPSQIDSAVFDFSTLDLINYNTFRITGTGTINTLRHLGTAAAQRGFCGRITLIPDVALGANGFTLGAAGNIVATAGVRTGVKPVLLAWHTVNEQWLEVV